MAALVLVVGVLATAGSVAGAVRDARRARAVDAAGELIADRVARWRAAPCAGAAGERTVGAARERWQVRAADGVGVLTDTVAMGTDPVAARVGVVAVAGCGP